MKTEKSVTDIVQQLEARLAELREKNFDKFPEPQKTAMETSNSLLIEDIEWRLEQLLAGRPDPYV